MKITFCLTSSITNAVAELTKSLVLKPKIDQVIHRAVKFVKHLHIFTGIKSFPSPENKATVK